MTVSTTFGNGEIIFHYRLFFYTWLYEDYLITPSLYIEWSALELFVEIMCSKVSHGPSISLYPFNIMAQE
jgi:hypothetical protein